MVGNILSIALGLTFVGVALAEIVGRLRLTRRMRRARGVFVGREEVGHVSGPGVYSRAARFRFTTEDGRTVERTSALSTFPGPRPGRAVTVVYDPERPHSTAERAGVHLAMLVLGPLVVVLGVIMVYRGWSGL
ncbi:hypothetical protein Acsp04_63620 [Actinomadura sp. NBRC 104425]|nr:hypothetical protein Acsp04_63620 [Actinomadura sp. NBRC 104425]